MAEISILHYIHSITGGIESHRSKVTCPKSQSFLCHLFIRGLLLHERNCEKDISTFCLVSMWWYIRRRELMFLAQWVSWGNSELDFQYQYASLTCEITVSSHDFDHRWTYSIIGHVFYSRYCQYLRLTNLSIYITLPRAIIYKPTLWHVGRTHMVQSIQARSRGIIWRMLGHVTSKQLVRA